MRPTRTLVTIAATALALTLTACGDSEPESAPAESDTTAEAQPEQDEDDSAADPIESAWTDEDEARYQEEYDAAQQHLLDNYGILESAELCDAVWDPEPGAYEDFLTEQGWDGEQNPADHGASEAVMDWCESAA